MGISIFKDITSQQSKEFWAQQLQGQNGHKDSISNDDHIDYAKDIDTYNGDFSFFMVPLLRSKMQEAKRSLGLSNEKKNEIIDLIYNSNLGDFYKQVLLDELESKVSMDAMIVEAKKVDYQAKAYFSTLLTVSNENKEKLPYLRSQIALSDSTLQRIATDMLNIIDANQYSENMSRN